jgi:hypothetical protein
MSGKKTTADKKAAANGRRKAGRPRIEFDLSQVEGLGQIGATAAEMAAILPASQSTIEHRMADQESDFSKAYKKGFGTLKMSLRRKQIQLAMAGDRALLIWLGKQLLGQTDKQDLRHGGTGDEPVAFTLELADGRPVHADE